MFRINPITVQSVDYFERQVGAPGPADLVDYYSEAGRGEGHEAAPTAFVLGSRFLTAEELDLAEPQTPERRAPLERTLGVRHGDTLSAKQVRAWFVEGRTPDGQSETGANDRTQKGYDCTIAAPKSVSLLWAFGNEEQQQACAEAHQFAVQESLRYLADHAALYQTRAGGKISIDDSTGISGAIYQHYTDRAGDPHIHSHVLLNARVQSLDGRWFALDSASLFDEAKAAGVLYQAVLRRGITERVGLAWQPVDRHTGMADLVGFDRETIEAWSNRSAEIREWREANGLADNEANRTIAQKRTRSKKDLSISLEDSRERWEADPRRPDLEQLSGERVIDPPASAQEVLEEATQEHSTLSRRHLFSSATSMLPILGSSDRVLTESEHATRAAAEAAVNLDAPSRLADPSVVRGKDGRVRADPHQESGSGGGRGKTVRLTSRAVLEQEAGALREALQECNVLADPEAVPMEGLDTSQLTAARGMVSDPRRVTPVVAPAGTGKTTLIKAAREAWQAAGINVALAAPTGAAADRMETAGAGENATTVATIMGQLERGETPSGWHRGRTVLVVDEAAMVSTTDLQTLIHAATKHDVKLVPMGDPEQMSPVKGRGGLLELLADEGPNTQRLETGYRLRDPAEREAALSIRGGETADLVAAADHYLDHGRLSSGSLHAMMDDAYKAWHRAAVEEGRDTLLMVPTWEHAQAMNLRGQRDLAAAGRLDLDTAGVQLRAGEIAHLSEPVVTRKNSYDLRDSAGAPVRNGHRWRVVREKDETGRVVLERSDDPERTVQVPPEYLTEHAQLGYATSLEGAQGATTEVAISLHDRSDRHRLYVSLSRGREENHAFLVTRRDQVADDAEVEQPILRDTREETTEAFVHLAERDDSDRSAHLWARRILRQTERDVAAQHAARVIPAVPEAEHQPTTAHGEERLQQTIREATERREREAERLREEQENRQALQQVVGDEQGPQRRATHGSDKRTAEKLDAWKAQVRERGEARRRDPAAYERETQARREQWQHDRETQSHDRGADPPRSSRDALRGPQAWSDDPWQAPDDAHHQGHDHSRGWDR